MASIVRPLFRRRLVGTLPSCLWLAVFLSGPVHPAWADQVDLALVLAVDVSSSIDSDRFELQRRGYAEAFRNPEVIAAIRNGAKGAIAVTLMEWSGPGDQHQVIDWRLIRDDEDARAFGSALLEAPRVAAGTTAIGDAIAAATALFNAGAHEADRRVIDVSGDGASNAGRRTDAARDATVATGITINGLPILANEPGVDDFYRQNVIGGASAFLIIARSFDSFAGAILDKLIREIAAATGDGWDGL
jgi:hypothetical protein